MTYEVAASRVVYGGALVQVRVDEVRMPDGATSEREVVQHPDSVAVVAIDEFARVVLLRQFRHAVRERLWELPAGLLDQAGEPPLDAARRELREETGLRAHSWSTLVDIRPSPGFSQESVRVYLATGLEDEERPQAGDEEQDLDIERVALPDALDRVQQGEITNGHTVAGLLAACVHFGVQSSFHRTADGAVPTPTDAAAPPRAT